MKNGDSVYCILTSNADCKSVATATSNTIKISVNTFTPSITIAATSSSICTGTSATFTATPVNQGTTPTYQWQINGSNVGNNSNTFTSNTLSNKDTVTCILTSSLTCVTAPTSTSNKVGMTVNVATSSNNNLTVCNKDMPYTWNGLKFTTAGTQTVHINNVAGCDSAATLKLTIDNFKIDSIGTNPISPVTSGTAMGVTLYANTPASTATWTPSYLFSGNSPMQNIVAPDTSFRIYATGYSANNCPDTLSKNIIVNSTSVFIPNALAPSAPNNTDISTLKVYGKSIKSAQMRIFNQWGQMIKELNDPTVTGWDGTYNGKAQPTGVYVYVVKITYFNNKTETRSGSINLIR